MYYPLWCFYNEYWKTVYFDYTYKRFYNESDYNRYELVKEENCISFEVFTLDDALNILHKLGYDLHLSPTQIDIESRNNNLEWEGDYQKYLTLYYLIKNEENLIKRFVTGYGSDIAGILDSIVFSHERDYFTFKDGNYLTNYGAIIEGIQTSNILRTTII
jgi:hypothetical protein